MSVPSCPERLCSPGYSYSRYPHWRSAAEARLSLKVVLDLPNGSLINRLLEQLNRQTSAARPPAGALAEALPAEAELRVVRVRRLVRSEAVSDGVVVADVAALRPTPNRYLVSPTNPNMAYKLASPISADWPRVFGMSPTS